MKKPKCKVPDENILSLEVEGVEGCVKLGDGGGEVGHGEVLVVQDVPGALPPPLLHTCKAIPHPSTKEGTFVCRENK